MTITDERFVEYWTDEHGQAPPMKWVICDRCAGEGTLGGWPGAFTEADRAEWSEEDYEDYATYRRSCEDCGGSGKVREFTAEAAVEWAEWLADDAADRATRRAESGWSW